MEAIERDDPIPVRTVCDSPEAMLEALDSLPECGEAVVVERDGKPIGAMIPMKDLALYQRLFFDREMEMDVAAVDRAKAEGGETIPWEVVKARHCESSAGRHSQIPIEVLMAELGRSAEA